MNLLPSDFHFLRPFWFLALAPAVVVFVFLLRRNGKHSALERFCDPDLLQHLLLGPVSRGGKRGIPLALLASAWLLTIVSLAGPAWKRQPQPVFRLHDARILALDLSPSMAAEDVKPSRLQRAVFKIRDVLQNSREGRTGLVVFGGEAHVVVPMTDDVETIKAMLPALSTDLIPVPGDSLVPALRLAAALLKQGGAKSGEILLLSDGIDDVAASIPVAAELLKRGIRLSVLGIGTAEGAPIPTAKGWFPASESGGPLLARFDKRPLMEIARSGGGKFSTLTVDGQDINRLMDSGNKHALDKANQDKNSTVERWREEGIFLVPIIVLLAAAGLRKGWLLFLVFMLLFRPTPSAAFTWMDLWETKEQQAMRALARGDAKTAAGMFADPEWRGMAQYQAGDYQDAIASFKSSLGADYNLGNSFAKAGMLAEALKAYATALKKNPDDKDARINHDIVEKLLRKQEQERQGKQNQAENKDDKRAEDNKNGGKQSADGSRRQGTGGEQTKDDKQGTGKRDETRMNKQDATAVQEKSSSQPAENRSAGMDSTDAGSQAALAGEPAPDKEHNDIKASQAKRADETGQQHESASQEPNVVVGDDTRQEGPEQDLVLDQWLRQVPDDPSGLLRRKFLLESQRNQKKR